MHNDEREALLARMTLEEKVAMLAGVDMWHTAAVERLGIPALKMSDGPNGARGDSFTNGTRAACFPAEIALASTWNPQLVKRIGAALGQEAKTKGAQVLLGPTANIQRTPLGGRNFESFSEDPYLSSTLAVAYIEGVQSEGIGATIKHFICNDSEFERNTISSEVDERTLHEIYLPPFKAAVQDANVWAIMASYNKLNGTYTSENAYTLHDLLRRDWGFTGLTMSDWFGTQSTTPAVNGGLDLEMPGPAIWRGAQLLQAVRRGQVPEYTIDDHVRRLLLLLERTGLFEHHEEVAEQAIDAPEHRALIREAAAEGIVLLKNQGQALPLQREELHSLAIIGPNAKVARIMAGGSAQVNAHYAITPYEGIMAKIGRESHIEVAFEQGCPNHKLLPLLTEEQVLAGSEGEEHGWSNEYFNQEKLGGSIEHSEISKSADYIWMSMPAETIDAHNFSLRSSARYTPPESGGYSFSLVSAGLSRLYVNGELLVDNWSHQEPGEAFFGFGSTEVRAAVKMEADRSYQLVIEYSTRRDTSISGLRLGMLPPQPTDAIDKAVALARRSDVALIFAGLHSEWESEGFDRSTLELAGQQNELIERVAAANRRTVVVLNSGAPLTMPWLDHVAAVLQAWYPGQECGNSIADVLFGDTNPSGKLPQTFPARLEDHPAYLNYPGENGKVRYGEGLFVGYRYYEQKHIRPLFPFGFGLSYTAFEYGEPRLSAGDLQPGETLQVQIDVSNTGSRAGQEVVQCYIHDVASHLHRPYKELKAFAKVMLAPNERQTVTFTLDQHSLAYYDDLAHTWVAEAGGFEVLIGASSQDIRAVAPFTLATTRYIGDTRQGQTKE